MAIKNQSIKKPRNREDVDLISDLPPNLMETILMKMPLQDAARTCILSSRWKDSWVKIPRLKLDAAFWQQTLQNQSQGRAAKFESILFRILLVHQGPTTHIKLHIPELESPSDFDTLVTYIVKNGIQWFYFENAHGRYCKLHSSLFTCPTLTSLFLKSCDVNLLPCTFERSKKFTKLVLFDVTISAQALQILVSSCPSLHTLRLRLSIDIQCLEIISPSLRYFSCYYLSSQSTLAVNYGQQHLGGILKLLGGCPNLEKLYMNNHSVKSLAAFGSPTRLPTDILHHLKSIILHNICLEDVQQLSFVLCLIASSPNLQKLKLVLHGSTVNNNNIMENLQDEEDYTDLTLDHLVDVKMLSVVGGRLELKFMRILLENSPSLRKMNIGLATSEIDGLRIIKQMFLFRRAAPNVEVRIEE